uniref:Uncharacterized protein n=1 Tax=Glossina austeni TaxID=7395 RepID=A0A1A9UIC3_GLOAU
MTLKSVRPPQFLKVSTPECSGTGENVMCNCPTCVFRLNEAPTRQLRAKAMHMRHNNRRNRHIVPKGYRARIIYAPGLFTRGDTTGGSSVATKAGFKRSTGTLSNLLPIVVYHRSMRPYDQTGDVQLVHISKKTILKLSSPTGANSCSCSDFDDVEISRRHGEAKENSSVNYGCVCCLYVYIIVNLQRCFCDGGITLSSTPASTKNFMLFLSATIKQSCWLDLQLTVSGNSLMQGPTCKLLRKPANKINIPALTGLPSSGNAASNVGVVTSGMHLLHSNNSSNTIGGTGNNNVAATASNGGGGGNGGVPHSSNSSGGGGGGGGIQQPSPQAPPTYVNL